MSFLSDGRASKREIIIRGPIMQIPYFALFKTHSCIRHTLNFMFKRRPLFSVLVKHVYFSEGINSRIL